jgi:hypothetical protein
MVESVRFLAARIPRSVTWPYDHRGVRVNGRGAVDIRYDTDFDAALEKRRLRVSARNWKPAGLILAALFLAAAALAALSWHHGHHTSDLALAVLLVGFGTYYGYLPFEQERRALRLRQQQHEGRVHVEITDEHVAAFSEHTHRAVRWTFVQKIDDKDRIWVGTTAVGGHAFTIPQELLTPAQVNELRVFMVGRGLLPPEYRVG